MGANRTQAVGVSLFFAAFVLIAAGMAAGGNVLLIVLGLVLLGVTSALFHKAKPWEHEES